MTKCLIKVLFGGVISCLAIIVIVFVSAIYSQKSAQNTLELVTILHRHGFRTPTETYPTDPYQEDSWPETWGQLLKKGKQQLYKLGKTFREHYKSFLIKYSSKAVTVRTSDLDRCHMSAATLLAGWFPPEDDEESWNKDLAWQPIPIHSVPRYEDNMLAQVKPCPKYRSEKKKVDDEIKKGETPKDEIFYKYLSDHTGENISTVRQVEILYTTLTIEELYGFTLPSWTKEVYPEKMKKKALISAASYQWTKLMQRLSAGPFLNELLKRFTIKSKGENNDQKLLLYSAHDSTLFSVWRALGFEKIFLPDFGSAFIFELHKSHDEHIVKMLYMKNTELTEAEELQIPGCQSPCKLDQLYNVTEDVRPVDWEDECNI